MANLSGDGSAQNQMPAKVLELISLARSQGWTVDTDGVTYGEYGSPSLVIRLTAHTAAGRRNYMLTWEQSKGRLKYKADRSCAYHLSDMTAK